MAHTWGEEEVTFQDMEGTHPVTKKGFEKIKRCCSIAIAHGFAYLWIDTCCIDKTSSRSCPKRSTPCTYLHVPLVRGVLLPTYSQKETSRRAGGLPGVGPFKSVFTILIIEVIKFLLCCSFDSAFPRAAASPSGPITCFCLWHDSIACRHSLSTKLISLSSSALIINLAGDSPMFVTLCCSGDRRL